LDAALHASANKSEIIVKGFNMMKIGFFSFTCCEGCTVMFIELLNKKFSEYIGKVDIQNIRVLRSNETIGSLDVAFVEGAISTQSEVKKLKEIREKSKMVVALGSGAANGYPSNQRNSFDEARKKEIAPLVKKLHQLDEISPISKFVKVDDEINGCPVSEDELAVKMEGYLKKFT
jgi:coenzyme F420-reducing hydrogenase gamma subunit